MLRHILSEKYKDKTRDIKLWFHEQIRTAPMIAYLLKIISGSSILNITLDIDNDITEIKH